MMTLAQVWALNALIGSIFVIYLPALKAKYLLVEIEGTAMAMAMSAPAKGKANDKCTKGIQYRRVILRNH